MKKTIHYVLILDQSGSMWHLQNELISSFNQQVMLIKTLQKNQKNIVIKVTLCMFNDVLEYKYEDKDIKFLQNLSAKDYSPNSRTALYDAIGYSFQKTELITNKNDGVFFAIFTDGLENASVKFSSSDIQEMIQKAEKNDWEVKFFCRYEDYGFYRNDLNLNRYNSRAIRMNEEGLTNMACEVMMCIEDISNKP